MHSADCQKEQGWVVDSYLLVVTYLDWKVLVRRDMVLARHEESQQKTETLPSVKPQLLRPLRFYFARLSRF